MTVFNPNSTTVSGVDALLVNVANSTVLVRDGVYLTTDGAGFKAINCTATNVTMLMDGYAVSDDSHAIEILSNSEIAIGTQGGVVANQNGINGTGLDNEIVNDGVITANGFGIRLLLSGHTVTNNGTINSGANDGISIAEGTSQVVNRGAINSASDGIEVGGNGTTSNSQITNSGTVSADQNGIVLSDANVVVNNSGEIVADLDAIRASAVQSDNYIITNSGIISGNSDAIYLNSGSHSINNLATGGISGRDYGIFITETGNLVSNAGTISGLILDAIRIEDGGSVVTNTGIVNGDDNGIYAGSADGLNTGLGTNQVINDGVVNAQTNDGIFAVGTSNTIVNRGSVSGGDEGIELAGSGSISNSGDVVARNGDGILVSGGLLQRSQVINSGTVTSQTGYGIRTISDNAVVNNTGGVTADADGIWLDGLDGRLSNSGHVTAGDDGLYTDGQALILNSGTVTADDNGVFISSSGTSDSRVVNTGDIVAGNQAIESGTGTNGIVIINRGLVSGGTDAVFLNGDGTETLFNSGEIHTIANQAVQGDDFVEIIRNSGMIVGGEIDLAGGDDIYRGSGTGFAETVLGGAGLDTMTGSAANDTFLGGADADLLRGRDGEDVLRGEDGDDDIGGGRGDDTLDGGANNDTLGGGEGSDLLIGGTGDDTLRGGEGADDIIGGADRDTLAGNGGNDTFIYELVTDSQGGGGADLIRDFEQGLDLIDLDAVYLGELSFEGTNGLAGGGVASVAYNFQSPTVTRILVDVDGDGAFDMRINVRGNVALTADDFVL
mgnify:CR=1 FL=1